MKKKFFSLLSCFVTLSFVFVVSPSVPAKAFDFVLKSSNSDLANAKLPVPSEEFLEATDIMLAERDYMAYWHDIKPSAEALALFKNGAEQGCPYSVAALGYNLVAWEEKINEGMALLIQADAENCVYGSMLLSQVFWRAERLGIPNITAGEATTYIIECLDRAVELQKYLDISMPINRSIREEVAWHINMFANNFGGVGERSSFIPANPNLYKLYLAAAGDMFKVLYPEDEELLKSIDADIKAVPDYIFWTMSPLCQRYAENVVAANRLFKNKTVRMTGSVIEIGETGGFFSRQFIVFFPPLDTYLYRAIYGGIFGGNDDPITVVATFKESEEEKIAGLYVGQEIIFQGKVSGLEEDSIVLMIDCVIIGGKEGD